MDYAHTLFADRPLIVFAIAFVTQWLAAQAGVHLRSAMPLDEPVRKDLGIILSAALTLLALIIGFSFSMAVTRYDQRQTNEEREAGAIGIAYIRAGLLPPPDAAKVRTLLKDYLKQRILLYTANAGKAVQISRSTTQLDTDLWSVVQAAALAQPSPITALAVTGVSDVLNTQATTQAGLWNRIPFAEWALLGIVALASNLLLGYSSRIANGKHRWFLILPLLVSTSLFLIADMDNPEGGTIHVKPRNLTTLSRSLN